MFYFYDSQSFNIVNCPPPRFKEKEKTGFYHLRKLSCLPTIKKNFTDANMMRSLSCFLQWVVYTSTPKNDAKPKEIPFLQQIHWIQNAITKGKKGGSGAVEFSMAFDQRLEITVKKALYSTDGPEMVHEYIVALYGTNHLRHVCPNFAYTFALYQSPSKIVRLAMEKIPGPQIVEYLRKLHSEPFSEAFIHKFLKVWVQIVLGLEVAQETLFFTHFDLHGQNVLVRPTEHPVPYLEFPVMDQVYRLENVEEVATLIDFGHSTIRYDKGFVGQIKNGFPEYGMYPFYVPGADLFKLMAYLWSYLYSKSYGASSSTDASSTNASRIGTFFQFCLDKFYGVQTTDPQKSATYVSLKKLEDTYYNGTTLPSAFYSPYDMLRFLESRKTEIFAILGIQAYPWKVSPISQTFTLYRTLRYRKKETYECYQDLFCSTVLEAMPQNLYHLTTVDTNPGLTQAQADLIFAKTVPLLKRQNMAQINAFLEPNNVWSLFTKYVEFKMTESRTKRIPFSRDMTTFIYFYRAYVCVLGYKSFLST